jgi:hypothetical protein
MLAVITRSPLLSSVPTRGAEFVHFFGDDDSDGEQPDVYLSPGALAGVNILALQRMLGHTSTKMTLDTYADLFDDDLDAAAATLHARDSPESVFKMCSRPAMDDS